MVILLADDLKIEKIFDVADRDKKPSRVSAVYQAPERNSFVAALKDVPEIWEISTDPNAVPVYPGLVHTMRKSMVEALPSEQGLFALRRIEISEPLDDFFFDPSYRDLLGANRDGGKAIVVNLCRQGNRYDPLVGMASSGLGHFLDARRQAGHGHPKPEGRQDQRHRHRQLDINRHDRDRAGPGFFMRSHEKTRYAWDRLVPIAPSKGRNPDHRQGDAASGAHIETRAWKNHRPCRIDRSGKHALVSVWEMDGALIVYDAGDVLGDQAPANVKACRQIQCL